MKSFFKKIALVLVLAMVVTMLPAKAVSAADTDGPQLSKQVKLYIGGDKTGSYSDAAYAKVWNKSGYTVEFSIDNEDVATVGKKKGLVEAVGVGTATVTAVFTNEDGETVEKTCKVVVKKNAVAVGISENSAKTLAEGIAVGEPFQPKVFRTSADGETSWKGKEVITDGARFESSDEEVFTVKKTTGKITAVGAGEATLSVWTVQGEKPVKDEEGKVVEYLATTEKVEYPVKVIAGTIVEVKQTTADTFEITCTDEKTASELSLDNLSVVYVANGIDIQAFVKSVAVKDDDNKNVAVVTMHNTIAANVTYKVTYGETTLEFVGAVQTPHHIAITTGAVRAGEDTEIGVAVYNVDDVDITATADVSSHVTFTADESTDYYVAGNKIYFFNSEKSATVTATYDMGWDDQGNEIEDLKATGVITSYTVTVTDGNISGWLVTNDTSKARDEGSFNNNPVTLAAGDPDFYIYGMYKRSDGSVGFTAGSDAFTYESTNESVLMVSSVDPERGRLYPVAAGAAAIIVKSNNVVVGVCNINVVASRSFATLEVSADKTKLSKNSDDPDQVTVTLTVKDQLGADIKGYSVDPTQVVTSDKKEIAVANWDGGNKVIITAGADATTTARTVYIKIEVSANGTTKSQTVAVSVKDVTGAAVSSYKVNVKDSIDLKLDAGKYADDGYNTTVSLDYFDAAGFYLGTKAGEENLKQLTTVADASTVDGEYSFIVTRNNQAIVVSGTTLVLVEEGSEVVSGSSELVKKDTGTYAVRIYKGNGTRAQLIASAAISVTDSTVAMTVVQDKQDANDIMGSLTFKRGNDTVDKATLICPNPLADAVTTPSGTYVRTLTVYEMVGTYVYKVVVNVNKLFK